MILKSIEICELNTDVANESTIKNFKEPSFYFFIYFFWYLDCMFLFIWWLLLGFALDIVLLRYIYLYKCIAIYMSYILLICFKSE